MKFDSLEIQRIIEEKRLIWGAKLEKFLLQKILSSGAFINQACRKFFARKDAVFFACLGIILCALVTLSTLDFGHDSAIYIEVAQKMLDGKKYYYDFFENNFPLAFFFTIIPIYFAKITTISPIVSTQYFVYLMAILALYFSYKTMIKNWRFANPKSNSNEIPILIKLTTISFCFGFFFRAYTMDYNELYTKSSYFLALLFVYISCHIYANNSAKLQIKSGILGGLIICLKPHYGIIIAIFEIAKFFGFFDKKLPIRLSILSASAVIFCYILLMLKFTPQYFQFMQEFSALYFRKEFFNAFTIFKRDIFAMAIFFIIFKQQAKNATFTKPLFLALLGAMLVVLAEFIGSLDQRSIIPAIAFPVIITYFPTLTKENRIKFDKTLFLVLMLLITPQFDPDNFFDLVLNLCCFWWTSLFFIRKPSFFMISLAILSIFLLFLDKKGEVSWLFCAFISLFLFYKMPKFDEKGFLKTEILLILTLILSYFLSLFFSSIFHPKKSSPHQTIQFNIIKKYAPSKNDKVIIISDTNFDAYPTLTYLKKQNPLPSLQFENFYFNINSAKKDDIFHNHKKTFSYLFSKLKTEILNQNTQLIFIKKKPYFNDRCIIDFLEYYFMDEEFKRNFTQNYEFLTLIELTTKQQEILIYERDFLQEKEIKYGEIEVYLRKK